VAARVGCVYRKKKEEKEVRSRKVFVDFVLLNHLSEIVAKFLFARGGANQNFLVRQNLPFSSQFAAMAKGSGHVYTKILLDVDDYVKLLNIQDNINDQEEKINNRLKIDEKAPEPNHEKEDIQSGSGGVSRKFLVDLTELVAKQLEKKFKFPENVQQGNGSNDLITEIPEEISPGTEEPLDSDSLPVSSTVHKSVLHDSFDDEKLLKDVPKPFQHKAQKLLEQLKKHPGEITWQSNGTIFLNQSSLFDSNIFILFPKLFKKVPHPENIPHLLELATTIASLGFGSLIHRSLISGLTRRNVISNEAELRERIKRSKIWYFLGE
jgi:hypothetical protein